MFGEGEPFEILDGFKRVRAARALGWPTLFARVDVVDAVDAKLRLCALHERRGSTELEEGWLVRSLYREDQLSLPEIACRMSRHRSWVWPVVEEQRGALEQSTTNCAGRAIVFGESDELAQQVGVTHLPSLPQAAQRSQRTSCRRHSVR